MRGENINEVWAQIYQGAKWTKIRGVWPVIIKGVKGPN